MNRRAQLLAELGAALDQHTDDAIEALTPLVRQFCRQCGQKTVRRDCFVEPDGTPYVYLCCSSCGWRRTIVDPAPPDGERRPRVRKSGKNGDIHDIPSHIPTNCDDDIVRI